MYNFFQKKKDSSSKWVSDIWLKPAVFMGKREELMEKVKSTKHHQPP